MSRRHIEQDRREDLRRTRKAKPIPRERPPRRGDSEEPKKWKH